MITIFLFCYAFYSLWVSAAGAILWTYSDILTQKEKVKILFFTITYVISMNLLLNRLF
jgi:hypothetical protein